MKQHIINVFKRYNDFKGRSGRAEFWYFFLLNFVLSWAISLVVAPILGATIASLLNLAVAIVFIVPGIAVGVRRMHDVNKCGWFILIPIYNIILAATEGDKHSNLYGPDPYSTENAQFDFEKQNAAK